MPRTPTTTARRRAFRPSAVALEGRTLLTAGALDTSFGTGGYTQVAGQIVSAGQLLPDGSILVVNTPHGVGSYDFGLAKFTGDGAPDTTFGDGTGQVETDFLGQADSPEALIVQPWDGKVVVVGSVTVGFDGSSPTAPSDNGDFGVVRYNPNGSLDTSFGGTGKVHTNISTYEANDGYFQKDEGRAVALQGRKILVAGESYSDATTQMDTTLVRYNPDGSLDTTFGIGGSVVTPISSGPGWMNESVRDLTVLPDGRILVLGFAQQADGTDAAYVARYSADGTLDTSFGVDGNIQGVEVVPNGGTGSAYGRGLAVLADGTILIAGGTLDAGAKDIVLTKLDASGALDPSFGSGGIVRFDSGSGADDTAFAMAVQPQDGRIIVAGQVLPAGGTKATLLTRFDADGVPDPTFGDNGFAIHDFSSTDYDEFTDVAIRGDGKIVAVGDARYAISKNTSETDILAARFLGDPPQATNVPPTASYDAYSVAQGATLTVDAAGGVLANDTDPNNLVGNPLYGQSLTAVLDTAPAHGTLALAADGSFAYTPEAGFTGADSFTYRAFDGTDYSAAPVTVSLTVRGPNQAPVAVDDSYAATQDTPLTVAAPGVLANDADPDGDPLTAVLVASPANGTVALNPDGSFTYTPNAGFSGSDSFTYRAFDGTADSGLATVGLTVQTTSGGGHGGGHGGPKHLAAAATGTGLGVTSLSTADARAAIDEARALWATALGLPSVPAVRVVVRDLPGATLGQEAGRTIVLDADAAGLGWFVDPTPDDSTEFPILSGSFRLASTGSSAAGRYGLLTAALHEFGHLLGFRHASTGLMQPTLAPGRRELPLAHLAPGFPGSIPAGSGRSPLFLPLWDDPTLEALAAHFLRASRRHHDG